MSFNSERASPALEGAINEGALSYPSFSAGKGVSVFQRTQEEYQLFPESPCFRLVSSLMVMEGQQQTDFRDAVNREDQYG
jgi:hypothetical protein